LLQALTLSVSLPCLSELALHQFSSLTQQKKVASKLSELLQFGERSSDAGMGAMEEIVHLMAGKDRVRKKSGRQWSKTPSAAEERA